MPLSLCFSRKCEKGEIGGLLTTPKFPHVIANPEWQFKLDDHHCISFVFPFDDVDESQAKIEGRELNERQ